MTRKRDPKFLPLRDLKVTQQGPNQVRLANRSSFVEVTSLAQDLFRLRAGLGRFTEAPPSSAVIKTDWADAGGEVTVRRNKVVLATETGALAFDLNLGGWEVFADGLSLFSAPPGMTGFVAEQARLNLDLAEKESVLGLGETTGAFDRRGLTRDFWNTDVLGHSPCIHPHLDRLYVSIPFGISLRNGRAAGIFWDNPARQRWDVGQTMLDIWQMNVDTGGIDLYFFLGPTVAQVVECYTALTGHMPMPPRWGLGFQQCRYSYETRERVEAVAREFRKRQLPCDAIYLDIHHMEGYRVFTFGKSFPLVGKMIAKLLRQGFKTIPIVDPGVKDDPHFGVCQRGIAANAFVKAADGKADVLGEAWPGVCRFPDFLNPAARLWWGQEQSALHTLGVAGYWTDMNEPANFARPDKTLPPDALHHTDRGVKPHSEVHNLYGFEMARATRDGALKDAPNERPFVVTRAGWAGIQRHALVWTGDNSSHWDHLADSIQMLMNLSLSGVAFCGADVGGFRGNATPELFARWFQMAALTPFFRNHSDIGTVDQEPWAFGEEVEGICRHYLQLRYRLMPYLYGLFAEAHRTGAPIMRPLLWHYQNDPVASACGDQFLLGRNILVAPMIRPGAMARSVYLPNDMWCDFWTGEMHQGGRHITVEAPLDTLPLFVRAGALIPMIEVQQYVGERPIESMELHCWPGGRDELEWYEDDGVTQRYEQGDFCRRTISAQTFKRTLTLDFGEERGSYLTPVKTWRLAIWGATRKAALKVNGVSIQGAFDPATGLFAADLPNTPGKVTLQFAGV